MKVFGIGCMHFSFKGGIEQKITVQDYIEEIKNALESLSNVNNVEIVLV